MAEYCEACKVPDHDTCSMTDGCPCCEDTIAAIQRDEPWPQPTAYDQLLSREAERWADETGRQEDN